VAVIYVSAQVLGGILGVWTAHLMFELPLWQFSVMVRTGTGQRFAEAVATFGLLTIFGCVARTPAAVPYAVGLYIMAADWFTASTSFRQSGRDDCPLALRYIRGDCASRHPSLRCGSVLRHARCGPRRSMAMAEAGLDDAQRTSRGANLK
jgi:glycerol uptake facilitator-like aquaporin